MEYVTTKEITLKLEQKMYSVRGGWGGGGVKQLLSKVGSVTNIQN